MPAGRPTKMTKEVLEILNDAWIANATVEEAALLADIDPGTIYNYKKENPEYLKKIERLKGLTSLKAKKVVNKAIDGGDIHTAKWHLERREKDYKPSTKNEVEVTGSKSLIDAILAAKDKGCGRE